jgi:hypothetical protein
MLSTSCKKCKTPTTSRQKMSLKGAKYSSRPKHLLQREHAKADHTGLAAHSPKHVFSEAEYVVGLSADLIPVIICIH